MTIDLDPFIYKTLSVLAVGGLGSDFVFTMIETRLWWHYDCTTCFWDELGVSIVNFFMREEDQSS